MAIKIYKRLTSGTDADYALHASLADGLTSELVSGLVPATGYTFKIEREVGGVTSTPVILTATTQASALVFDSSLLFTSFTTSADHGVHGTVAATDADLKFEFNAITPRTGNPMSMLLRVSAADVMVIDFFSDYAGLAFRFTDAAGVQHTGVFTDGTLNY